MPTKVTSELLPYMQEYYDPAKNTTWWLPGVMTVTNPNRSSIVVNTDKHGFRHSTTSDAKTVSIQNDHASIENIIIGGSTGFGIGASSDSNTLSSQLADLTGEKWGNFCIRAHTLQQQQAQFSYFMPMFKSLKRIIIFCGLNEIEAYHRCVIMPEVYGPFFAWNQYFQRMNSHHMDLESKTYNGPEDGHLVRINDHEKDHRFLMKILSNSLATWKMFAKACDADLYYAFQPLPYLMNRRYSPEEARIFAHMASVSPETFDNRVSQNKAAYENWYKEELEEACNEYDIPFLNINSAFEENELNKKWLFVDTSHFTDFGHKMCARMIFSKLGFDSV